MFIAPFGVGILVLFIEYFGIRHAAMNSLNIHTILRVIVPIFIVIIGIGFGFFIYQTNKNFKLVSEIRELIREQNRSESAFYTAKEVK